MDIKRKLEISKNPRKYLKDPNVMFVSFVEFKAVEDQFPIKLVYVDLTESVDGEEFMWRGLKMDSGDVLIAAE